MIQLTGDICLQLAIMEWLQASDPERHLPLSPQVTKLLQEMLRQKLWLLLMLQVGSVEQAKCFLSAQSCSWGMQRASIAADIFSFACFKLAAKLLSQILTGQRQPMHCHISSSGIPCLLLN